MKKWIALIAAILVEVAASLSLSAAQQDSRFFIVVVVGYVLAFVALSLVLRWGMPLAIAYGIWGAAGVALTAIFGAVFLGDALSPTMFVGIVLIVGGVILVEVGSPREHDPATVAEHPAPAVGTKPR